MNYVALATDYDGTIASDGVVDADTLAALERLREGSRRLILVTGRELDDLCRVFPRLDLFDRVIAENGALLYRPDTRQTRKLGEPPPAAFAQRLRERGVSPLSEGEVIVATWEPNEAEVLAAIRELGLEHQIIFNKGAVMVLPPGVNKGTGLRAALDDLQVSPHNCVGVGDAENDNAFLGICGLSAAVANALPALKEAAAIVTRGARGAGVAELIDRLLATDLAEADGPRQMVALATEPDEAATVVPVVPFRESMLLAGSSGGGKSTLTLGLLERLDAAGYQYCVIDPEGDYEATETAVGIGTADAAPRTEAVLELLRKSGTNVVVNLLNVMLPDRPGFLAALLPPIMALRHELGRPHMIVVDEAHHMLPASDPARVALPGEIAGFLFLTSDPAAVAPDLVNSIRRLLVVGSEPERSLRAFAECRDLAVETWDRPLETGEMLCLTVENPAPRLLRVIPNTGTRRRHLRKYAEGRLGEDKSFYFRGPDGSLNLRAYNLVVFTELAEGVDDATWQFHRERNDFSRWIAQSVKDDALAKEVASVEHGAASPAEARANIRAAVERRYTRAG